MNARELGGFMTQDGFTVKRNLLIRSGRLSGITPSGMQMLQELNVTKILDLRASGERAEYPDPEIDFAETVQISILNERAPEAKEAASLISKRKVNTEAFIAQFNEGFTMGNVYMSFVQDACSRERIAQVLRIFTVQPEGEAVLWHCNGGKDRTGLISLLLLSVFGVNRQEAVEDFMYSNVTFKDEIEQELEEAKRYTTDPEILRQIATILGVSLDNLNCLLEYVDTQFGSVEGFLTSGCGLTADELGVLKNKYLEKGKTR